MAYVYLLKFHYESNVTFTVYYLTVVASVERFTSNQMSRASIT